MVGRGATPSMGLSQFRGGKKSASAVGKKALELHKMEHEAMESEAHGMGRHLGQHITSLHGSGFFDDFAKGFMSVAKVAKPLIGLIPHPAAQAASGVLGALGAGTKKGMMRKTARKAYEGEMEGGMDTGAYKGEGKKKRVVGAGDGRRKRAEVVKRVMAERGLSMIEASKVVKAEGLY